MSQSAPRTLICLATYNERENLEELLAAIHRHAPEADILVIDDNSPDGTGQVADEIASRCHWVRVLHRAGKLGLGTAILAGMHFTIENGYDQVLTMDADGSHSPRYLPAMLEGMRKYDVMIGSRYVPGGGVINWPKSRAWMSWGVNILCRVLMRLPVKDCSGGYRCYRVGKLKVAQLGRMLSHGYSFQEEVLYRCRRVGCKIGETPIVFENRRLGASKLNRAEVIRSLAVLVYLGLQVFFGLD